MWRCKPRTFSLDSERSLTMDRIRIDWTNSTLYSECSWHQLSPYIGRMKSSMAQSLVAQFTEAGDTVYDPFCGAGTGALEAWIAGRKVIAGDLNPYAYVLSRAKLYPPRNIRDAIDRLDACWRETAQELNTIDLRRVPSWVRAFFHPETLREAIALRNVLLRRRQWFLLSCLLGILHHWRPGFLSYPSSHTVPYLRDRLFPRSEYPQLYGYRHVYPRLFAKVHRAFRRVPDVNHQLLRRIKPEDAAGAGCAVDGHTVSAIITSPPYMNSLSYARDNRLRLWFLGVADHRELERAISPGKTEFLSMMRSLLPKWSGLLARDRPCIVVLGAVRREGKYHNLPEDLLDLVRDTRCGLRVTAICRNLIPDSRRARVKCRSTREDTILVFRKGK